MVSVDKIVSYVCIATAACSQTQIVKTFQMLIFKD